MALPNLLQAVTERFLQNVPEGQDIPPLPYALGGNPDVILVPAHQHEAMKFKPSLLIREDGIKHTVFNPNMPDCMVTFRSLSRAVQYLLEAE